MMYEKQMLFKRALKVYTKYVRALGKYPFTQVKYIDASANGGGNGEDSQI